MARGRLLSFDGKAQIRAFYEVELSKRAIFRQTGRSLCSIHRFLEGPDVLISNSSCGRPCKVAFSDEKKFNLVGPDGNKYYGRDLRKEPVYFSRRNSGGGSHMVWGAFSNDVASDLAFPAVPNSIRIIVRVRQVCANNRQFQSTEELKQAIIEAWRAIGEEHLRNSVSSMLFAGSLMLLLNKEEL
ncbi:unnamed protein product [Haemonchus placei]|uniref:DDE Tnp4 domain-containing protein n=1 Tax=Haemonchus placei TaxID=6290 RepID=A0A0N4W3V5_HAEPC|nr:unnamed protein product [Haemonchus placei]